MTLLKECTPFPHPAVCGLLSCRAESYSLVLLTVIVLTPPEPGSIVCLVILAFV